MSPGALAERHTVRRATSAPGSPAGETAAPQRAPGPGIPPRRAIVERLSRGPTSVSDLAKPLDITLAAVVQHLQVLEESGLVRTEKLGRVRSCHIKPEGLRVAEEWIADRRSLWERRFDRLGQLLEEPERSTPTTGKKDKS